MYEGETIGKKLARLHVWRSAKDLLGDSFYKRTHLCLSSRHAGDVSVLLGLGVDPRKIVACDIDQYELWLAKKRVPVGVRMIHGSVEMVAKSIAAKEKIGCAFLDFCGPITRPCFETVRGVVEAMPIGSRSILVVGNMRGRDRYYGGVDLFPSRSARRFSRFITGRSLSPRNNGNAHPRSVKDSFRIASNMLTGDFDPSSFYENLGFVTATERRLSLWFALLHLSFLRMRSISPFQAVSYRGRGVPMSISLLTVNAFRENGRPEAKPMASFDDETSASTMLAETCNRHGSRTGSLLLAISEASARAYIAHATRGTYIGKAA